MKNRIFTNKRPNLSNAEIESFKNFEGVLDKVSQTPPSNPGPENSAKFNFKTFLKYSKNIFIAGVGIAATVFAMKWFSNGNSDSKSTISQIDSTEAAEVRATAIAPPVAGLETPFETYTIDAQKDETITTPTGTKIHIEKNTFLDKNGNVLKGKVNIKFREYHNVIDIFKSGIPMEYDSAGTTYTFESAGMFDIEAEKDGNTIQSYDKDILVDIVSDNPSSKFNDYYYDTTKRSWEFLSKSTILETEESDEATYYNENDSGEIFSSDIATSANTPAAKQPTAPNSPVYPPLLSAKYAFEVDFNKAKFPEIYKRSVFQVDETESNFSPVYYKVKWDIVELTKLDEKDKYELHLEKGDKKLDVKCFPAISKEEYNRLKGEYDAANRAYQDSLAIWNRWVASQKPATAQNDHMVSDIERKVVASLSRRRVRVNLPGVYNCDHPIFSQNYFGDKVMATFRIGDSATVGSIRNYTVERHTNALFGARNGNEVILDKSKNLVVWVWTTNHQIGIIESNQLKNYKRKQDFDVALYPAEEGLARLDVLLTKL